MAGGRRTRSRTARRTVTKRIGGGSRKQRTQRRASRSRSQRQRGGFVRAGTRKN